MARTAFFCGALARNTTNNDKNTNAPLTVNRYFFGVNGRERGLVCLYSLSFDFFNLGQSLLLRNL